jgi:hypothetical protein
MKRDNQAYHPSRSQAILWSGLLCCLLMATSPLAAQQVSRTGYFMDNATHRHLLNPALNPVKGYISLPVAGEFYLGLESNMKFTNFVYPPAGGGELLTFMHKDVDANAFLSQLSLNNYLRTDIRTSLLSLGFYTGASFWTFDVATRVNLSLDLPYDLFAFLKQGMTSSQGNLYHLGNLFVSSSVLAEASLGYSRNIMNNLRVGAKVKMLVGGARIKAGLTTMDVNMTPDAWTITTNGLLEAYAKGLTLKTDEEGVINGQIDFASPGPAGLGAAVDLGVNYSPIRNLDVSLALIDLGAIKWNMAAITRATSSGQVTFSGIENFGIDSIGQQSAEDQMTILQDDLLKMAQFKPTTATEDVVERLFPTVNAGVEYAMLKNKISLGVLYSNRFMEDERYSELTGSLNLRPARWFNLSGSYSFIHGKRETFGFALGFIPAIMNIYLACDYTFFHVTPQFIPLNTLTTNIQLGVSIPLGRGKVPPKH